MVNRTLRAIGTMSGTSLDGIDVALVETDGETISAFGPTGYRPYTETERALLRAALGDAGLIGADRTERPGRLGEAEDLVTRAHAQAIETFLREHSIDAMSIDAIGFHGQTVIHRPDLRVTVQIGDGGALAQRLAIPVVHDLRRADMEAGGQGAPLVPVFHRALALMSRLAAPVAIVNVGGVSNVTFIGTQGGGDADSLIAFDTGPGNAMLDDWMRERTGCPMDTGGQYAARGRADETLLAWVLVHPFFGKSPPKSLDRNAFSHRFVGNHGIEDGAATLTAFTARSIARSLDHVRRWPKTWIVCGGGARNDELLRLLRFYLQARVVTSDDVGWSASFLEAQAFAYLAVRSLNGMAITYPSTTGVGAPTTGGVLAGGRFER